MAIDFDGTYVPVTPAGTPLFHLEADTKEQAVKNLLKDAAHMPYRGWNQFRKRGYRIVPVTPSEDFV